MQIPFLDLKANYLPIKEEILKEIGEVLDNTAYILGSKVFNFEKIFAEAHHVKHCLGLSSGTDGNHLASVVLDIQQGDELIMPANTFIATAWGATLCGAKPVFVDCEPDSYNIDPTLIEKAITSRTKAIVAVHLYGQPANLDPILEIARKYKIALIEDAAQAHLAEYKSKKVGGLADVAAFSFYPGKNLGAYGEAGALTTNDDLLAEKAKKYREHGQSAKYHHETLGHNYRMEAIQGAVLGVKMKYISHFTEQRRLIAAKYKHYLKDIPQLTLPKEMPYAKHVYHLFVVQTDEREKLQQYLQEEGVSTGLHYPIPLHLQNCFKYLDYREGDFPETEKLAKQCLSLPMYPEMTDIQVEYVCEKIINYFKKQ